MGLFTRFVLPKSYELNPRQHEPVGQDVTGNEPTTEWLQASRGAKSSDDWLPRKVLESAGNQDKEQVQKFLIFSCAERGKDAARLKTNKHVFT